MNSINDISISNMKARHNVVLKSYVIDEILNLNELYKNSDKNLQYHNSSHILDMLKKLFKSQMIKYIPDDLFSLFVVAVIYHDCVYGKYTPEISNEQKSIDKFVNESLTAKHLTPDEIKYIADLIRSTEVGADYKLTNSMSVLHDLDYSGFAEEDLEKFTEMQNNVLEECFSIYYEFPKKDIILKRIDFLSSLVKEDYIFVFNEYSNEIAKSNIKLEIRRLLNKV